MTTNPNPGMFVAMDQAEDRFAVAVDLAVKGYMREWDGPETHNSKLATAIAILHQTADDWAENLVGEPVGHDEALDAKEIAQLKNLLNRWVPPSIIYAIERDCDDDRLVEMAADLRHEQTGEAA